MKFLHVPYSQAYHLQKYYPEPSRHAICSVPTKMSVVILEEKIMRSTV